MAKGIYSGGTGVFKWMFPFASMDESRLESTVNQIIDNYQDIRVRISKDPALKEQLRYSVRDTYTENFNLRRLGGYVDTLDKFLVPIDMVADYMKIMGGVGFGISTLKEIVEASFKLPYIAYYTAKTGDLVGAVTSLIYEGLSWFVPGSLLDLTNRYAKQADKYLVNTSAKKFLESIQGLEAKLAGAKEKAGGRTLAPQPA
ncbi:hypothetical protein HY637_02950 [Candidatus Woesearchaeota archaeon]|nr:hypothetical protein [Candidatus Woesearchaeota archaeon]